MRLQRAPAAAIRRIRERVERPRGLDDPFGTFVRDDGTSVTLWRGYRDVLKPGWREYWWPVHVLLAVRRNASLPQELEELSAAVLDASTLPAPAAELAAAVQPLADLHPELVTRLDDGELALVETSDTLASRRRLYAAAAHELAATLEAHGLDISQTRALEIGCGTGYLTYALAALGAPGPRGIDRNLESTKSHTRAAVRELFPGSESASLVTGDAEELPFADASFDLVHSSSTVEHLVRVEAVLRETRRALRRGGLARHTVHYWFGTTGGHSLCSVDFPWGHARLTPVEFERYLRERRPNEAEAALDFYREGFQQPRLTVAETRVAVEGAGFEILEWQHHASDVRYRRLARRAVPEVRAVSPRAHVSDLLTEGFTLVLRAR
jgi:ubiquinone/menaquinone biosynthesis C-methylase UbiE